MRPWATHPPCFSWVGWVGVDRLHHLCRGSRDAATSPKFPLQPLQAVGTAPSQVWGSRATPAFLSYPSTSAHRPPPSPCHSRPTCYDAHRTFRSPVSVRLESPVFTHLTTWSTTSISHPMASFGGNDEPQLLLSTMPPTVPHVVTHVATPPFTLIVVHPGMQTCKRTLWQLVLSSHKGECHAPRLNDQWATLFTCVTPRSQVSGHSRAG